MSAPARPLRRGWPLWAALGLAASPAIVLAQELTALGRHLVEVYDREALAEYVFRSGWHVALVVVVAAVAWLLTRDAPPGDVERLADRAAGAERAIVVAMAIGAAVFSAWVSIEVLGGVPHVQDSRAYVFQARLLAQGRLSTPVLPGVLAASTDIDFTVQDGDRWYGRFPPGWPAVLALAVRLGIPALANPLLTGIGIVLLHLFLRRSLGPRSALIATALVAVGPYVTLMGGSYLSHPFGLILTLAALGGYRSALEGPNGYVRWATATGALFVTRPPEAVMLAVVPGVHLLWRAARGSGSRRGVALALAIGLAFGGMNLMYNRLLTGNAFLPPTLRFDPTDHPGFSDTIGVYGREGHNLARGIHTVWYQWIATNDILFGWPYLSLVPALLGLLTTGLATSFERGWFVLLLVYEAFLLTWHSPGFGFGPRYQYCLIPLFALLSARGFSWLWRRASSRGRSAAALVLVYLTVLSFLTHYPRRLETLRFYYRVLPAHMILGDRDPSKLAVVVPELWIEGRQEVFASFEAISTPWPDGPGVVAARQGKGVVAALRAAFPGREVVVLGRAGLEAALERWVGRPVELTASPEIPDDLKQGQAAGTPAAPR